jgi:hypothetical protein
MFFVGLIVGFLVGVGAMFAFAAYLARKNY